MVMTNKERAVQKAVPRSPEDVAWSNFRDRLCGAVMLVGGTGSDDLFNSMSLRDVYKHLHPNGIRLAFTVDTEEEDDIGQTINRVFK